MDLPQAVETSSAAVFILFLVFLGDRLLQLHAYRWGIVPRTWPGLIGIVCSPLLHASWSHLLANALPLLVLLILLLADPRYHPWRTLGILWAVSGLGTWLIGRSHSVHIGASSIIFGLITYLMTAGFLMRSWRSAFVAVLVLFLFGSVLYGILPQRGPISWEGHLCGALAGIWTARMHHLRARS